MHSQEKKAIVGTQLIYKSSTLEDGAINVEIIQLRPSRLSLTKYDECMPFKYVSKKPSLQEGTSQNEEIGRRKLGVNRASMGGQKWQSQNQSGGDNFVVLNKNVVHPAGVSLLSQLNE